jgi:hypothetical protein
MTDAPAETPASASLLEDAARLATAANEKLGEAMAIAEQTRRDAAFNADRQWFKSRPDRGFRARLATAQEIEDLHTSKAWPPGGEIDGGCFVYAVVKHESPARLEALYFVLPPPRPGAAGGRSNGCGATRGRGSLRLRGERGSELHK